MPDSAADKFDLALMREEWKAHQRTISRKLLEQLSNVVSTQTPALVARFYRVLEKDNDAREFLSERLIRDKLQSSLSAWLRDLFPPEASPEFSIVAEKQLAVGAIHARINLPLKLVNRGYRVMSEGLVLALLQEARNEDLGVLLCYASSMLSMAIEIMNSAYAAENSRAERSEEAYRLFSLGQNLSQEKEAQRAALAEWLQTVLFRLASGEGLEGISALSNSEFGLWLTHRGGIVFDGMPELDRTRHLIDLIDNGILPEMRKGMMDGQQLSILNMHTNEIKSLVAECFNTASRIEGGHDPLTRTLNRRFMGTILSREVNFSRRKKRPFSIVIVDIDHFKSVNDRFGHSGGDTVLQQCADTILGMARVGDFVFRYGGEEFLVALVETSLQDAISFGDRIRIALSERTIHLPGGDTISVTASVGVAEASGTPDYTNLIASADTALYRAKSAGRNRVVAAS